MVSILPSFVTFPPAIPTANDTYLLAQLNGSDIPDPAAFRSAIGLGSFGGAQRNRFLASVSTLAPGGLTAFEQYIPASPDDPLRIAYTTEGFVNSGDALTSGLLSYLVSVQGLSLTAANALVAQILAAST